MQKSGCARPPSNHPIWEFSNWGGWGGVPPPVFLIPYQGALQNKSGPKGAASAVKLLTHQHQNSGLEFHHESNIKFPASSKYLNFARISSAGVLPWETSTAKL